MSVINKDKSHRLRYIKLCADPVINQGDNNFDLVVTSIPFGGENVQPYMTGAQYEVKNSNLADEIVFQVVHPQLGVLDEFARISAIDGSHMIETYVAKMYIGTTVRLKYIRSGGNEPTIKCNILRHINSSESV